jgi:hypothetical protein
MVRCNNSQSRKSKTTLGTAKLQRLRQLFGTKSTPQRESPKAYRIPSLGAHEQTPSHCRDGQSPPTRLNWKHKHLPVALVLYIVMVGVLLASELFLSGDSEIYFFGAVRAQEATVTMAEASFSKPVQ